MAVLELETFRKKYPQYGDMDDATLARRLADKYPAYADLPGKVEAVQTAAQTQPLGPLARQPVWQTLVSRPAAQYRGFIRGVTPGGETPLQGLARGALAQGQELAQRARGFDIQLPAIEQYYQSIAERQPGQYPTLPQVIGGFAPSAAGVFAEMGANIATSPLELATAIAPFSRAGKMATEAVAASRPGQAIGRFLTKELSTAKFPKGLTLTEEQLAKMPPPRRARYLEVQRMREEKRLGRQIGHFEEQARLRRAQIESRAAAGEEAITRQQVFGKAQAEAQRETVLSRLSVEEQNHIATLDEQRATVDSMLTETAKQKTIAARQPFFDTAEAHSVEYDRLMRASLTTPEAQRARVTMRELQELVETLYPYPEDIADARLARNTMQLFTQPLETTFEPSVILNEIDSLALKRGGYSKLRVYSRRQRVADDLRTGLIDLLEQKGVDFRPAKEYWRPWAKVRDKAIKVIRPWEDPRFPSYSGARELEQVAQNLGPVEVVREIEREIGFNLTDELRVFVSQQDANTRARLLAKVHFEALKEEAGFAMTRTVADLSARAEASTTRLTGSTARKLAGVTSERTLQEMTARAASERTLTRIEQLQRRAVQQAHGHQMMKRIMRRAIYGLAAYGGAKQVPILKELLP